MDRIAATAHNNRLGGYGCRLKAGTTVNMVPQIRSHPRHDAGCQMMLRRQHRDSSLAGNI
jgi:hypothetical protein